MAVAQSDIKYYKSNGTGSNGGTITATEITDNSLNNLFPDVSAADAVTGLTTYRKIFVKNTHASDTWSAVKLWISQATTSEDDEFTLAAGDASDADGSAESYSSPTSLGTAISLGDLAAGASAGIWIKRVVSAEAAASANNSGQITCQGETA